MDYIRDLAKTSLLSKCWRNLWTYVSCLDFFDESPKLISGVLAQWRGAKIWKFAVLFIHTRPLVSDIDSWLLFAIEKKVENLSIELGRCYLRNIYCPPQRLYSFPSITFLSLLRCELKKIEESVQWNQLKSLTIEGEESLSANALNRFLAGAPHLEELYLSIYKICENYNIRSRSLKILQICTTSFYGQYNCDVVVNAELRIWAPSLLTLKFMGVSFCCCLLDVPSLTEVRFCIEKTMEGYGQSWDFSPFEKFIHVFRSICHVEKVTLSEWCIKCIVYMKKKDMLMPLSNAKILKLYAGDAEEMLHVLEMFPNLMVLTVKHDPNYAQITIGEETRVEMVDKCISLASRMAFSSLSLLQLKTVEIDWSTCTAAIIPAIEILLKNAHMLEMMVLQVRDNEAKTETSLWL